jgi:hypothetical protein
MIAWSNKQPVRALPGNPLFRELSWHQPGNGGINVLNGGKPLEQKSIVFHIPFQTPERIPSLGIDAGAEKEVRVPADLRCNELVGIWISVAG